MIAINGNETYLGTFDTAIEAHSAYVSAAKKLRGSYFNPGG